jgi:hypothetical protein
MLKVDEFLLFTFDLSVLDEEGERWVVHEPTTEPPPESDRTKVCACRRHPSGSIMPANPNCMICRGTGQPGSSEVYSTVFDGTGKFTESRKETDEQPDGAQMVRFR